MAWVKNVSMKPVYVCDSCGFGYKNPKHALECEAHCRKSRSPSAQITRKADYAPE